MSWFSQSVSRSPKSTRDLKSKGNVRRKGTEGKMVFVFFTTFIRNVCRLVHYSLDEGEVMSSTSCIVLRATNCVLRWSYIELKTFGERSNWRSIRCCFVVSGQSLAWSLALRSSHTTLNFQEDKLAFRWWIPLYLPRRKNSPSFPSGSALPLPSFSWTGWE